jgi:ribokinase
MPHHDIIVFGIFVVDAAFRGPRLPVPGETLIGSGFDLGPGGKGSNQAVAAAKSGGSVGFITRVGQDDFAKIGDAIWAEAGVTPLVTRDGDGTTGAAGIFIDETTAQNSIIVAQSVAAKLGRDEIERHADTIAQAKVAITQLEQPVAASRAFLQRAKDAGVITILNPAPAVPLSDDILSLCDYITPNETEAAILTGMPVHDIPTAETAARALFARGVRRGVVITLGAQGAVGFDRQIMHHISPMHAGDAVDTTGAGDAFNGGFATALAGGDNLETALKFATATAALSVTRKGAAVAMPTRDDILALLGGN